jgi:hypothetical protein
MTIIPDDIVRARVLDEADGWSVTRRPLPDAE